MKRWQWITIILLCSVVPLWRAGTALAQDREPASDILSYILAKIAVLADGTLDYFVSSNALTDPMGQQLAGALASIVQSLTVFFAQFSLIL